MGTNQLDEMAAALRAAAAAPAGEQPDAAVVEELLAAREVADSAEALYLTRLETFHSRGLSKADGLSTRSWLRHKARVSPGEATRAIKAATGLTELPEVRDALVAGAVRPGHASALVDAASMLGAEVIAEAAPALVQAASEGTDPGTLRRTLNGFGAAVESPRAVRAAEHRDEGRWLTIASTFEGAVSIEGLLGAEAGAVVQEALGGFTTPAGPDDRRTAAQCRADGLVELCRRQLDAGRLPSVAGERPHVTIVTDLATIEARSGGHGTLLDGSVLRGDAVRRLGCDAKITRLIVGPESQPLDVGRTQRTITPAQRKALNVRDRGCRFPGCDRPPVWCDGHHIVFWSDGGETDLDNLVLLCRRHHTLIHEGRWRIHLGGPGEVRFLNPHGETVTDGQTDAAALIARMLALNNPTMPKFETGAGAIDLGSRS